MIYYIDNERKSEEVYVFLSGIGLDHYDFEKVVYLFGKRSIALTLPGLFRFDLDKKQDNNYSYTFEQYVKFLVSFLNTKEIQETCKNKKVILVGFSMGADLFLEAIYSEDIILKVNNAILLDANHGSTYEMFITKVLKSAQPEKKLIKETNFNFKDKNRSLRYLYDVFSKRQVTRKQLQVLAKSYFKYIAVGITNNHFNERNMNISNDKRIKLLFIFRDGITFSHGDILSNKELETFKIGKKDFIRIGYKLENEKVDNPKIHEKIIEMGLNADIYYGNKERNKENTIYQYPNITLYSGFNKDNKVEHFDLIEYKFLIELLYKYETILDGSN